MKKLFFKKKGFTPTPKFGVSLRSKRGFTLIELLVVIAIIGLLATIVLVSLNSARQKARDVRRISDLRQVALALEMYYDDNRFYPSVPAGTCTTGNYTGTLTTALSGGATVYMPAVPQDPLIPARNYTYGTNVAASAQRYVLQASLEANNTALATDVDLSPYGCTCTDASPTFGYCIQP